MIIRYVEVSDGTGLKRDRTVQYGLFISEGTICLLPEGTHNWKNRTERGKRNSERIIIFFHAKKFYFDSLIGSFG